MGKLFYVGGGMADDCLRVIPIISCTDLYLGNKTFKDEAGVLNTNPAPY